MGSFTGTNTFTRFSLIRLQVLTLLQNAGLASSSGCEKVSKGLEGHYIKDVIVQGIYNDKTIGAEIRITIDWDEHTIMLKAGGSSMQAPSNWINGVSPTLNETINTFNEACKIAGLNRDWCIVYCSKYDSQKLDKELGFVDAEPRTWRNKPEQLSLGFGSLSEAKILFSLGID